MIKAKVEDQRASTAAVPEIGEQGDGPSVDASVDGAALSRRQGDAAGSGESLESRCDFVLHDADGEWLMRQNCPEIERKAEG